MKDQAYGYCNAVSPDVKRKQSIQILSKGEGSSVGQTTNLMITVAHIPRNSSYLEQLQGVKELCVNGSQRISNGSSLTH